MKSYYLCNNHTKENYRIFTSTSSVSSVPSHRRRWRPTVINIKHQTASATNIRLSTHPTFSAVKECVETCPVSRRVTSFPSARKRLQQLKQVLRKVIWKQRVSTPHGRECTRPLRVLLQAAQPLTHCRRIESLSHG